MCLPDVVALCSTVPPRSGPTLRCLQQNADKLNKACRDSPADQNLLNGSNGAPKRP